MIMKGYDACESYSVKLPTLTMELHNRNFAYDDKQDKENLFETIQLI